MSLSTARHGAGKESSTNLDEDTTLQYFDGTPVRMAYWLMHTGEKAADDMSREATTLLERGIGITSRALVVIYNRTHMLCG